MGAMLQPFPSRDSVRGLVIKSMSKDSKLRTYGLQENDINLTIDGTPVNRLVNFSDTLAKHPGKIGILRPQTLVQDQR